MKTPYQPIKVYNREKGIVGVTKIRSERQEYPNKRFDEAIDEKLPTVIKMRAPIAENA